MIAHTKWSRKYHGAGKRRDLWDPLPTPHRSGNPIVDLHKAQIHHLSVFYGKTWIKLYQNKEGIGERDRRITEMLSVGPLYIRAHAWQEMLLLKQFPARLLCPWDSPGKNTGVGCHFLLQGIFPTQGLNLGLLHCRQILDQLSYDRRPIGMVRYRNPRGQVVAFYY